MDNVYTIELLYDFNGDRGRHVAHVASSLNNAKKYIKDQHSNKPKFEKTKSGWRETNSPFPGTWYFIRKIQVDGVD